MSEWIEWKGGECPVQKGAIVEYKLRGGYGWMTKAKHLSWKHYKLPDDIVAYRIIKEGTDTGNLLLREDGYPNKPTE